MSALALAIPLKDTEWSFGLDAKRLSRHLRNLADDLDRGRVIPQQVRHSSRLVTNDFPTQVLIVRYVERAPSS